MKRTEAIEHLQDFMKDHVPLDYRDAETLLDFIEGFIGMEPPFSFDVYYKNWNKTRDPVGCSGHEWDKEDKNEETT